MNIEQVEARLAAISEEIKTADKDGLDALNKEMDAIEARKAQLNAENRASAVAAIKVANGAGEVVSAPEVGIAPEVRSTKAYIDAYADYVKTGDDRECRALLTELVAGGSVPVPTYIEGRIRTAWEKNGIMNLVRKSYLKGVVGIGFELSATDAAIHTEGDDPVDEEELVIGKVTLSPVSLKKFITISDEAIDMGGEEFLDYIFDELTYKIAKLAEDTLIGMVATAGTTATSTAVSVTAIADDGTDILSVVPTAIANLSDEAANPVIVMNKLTYAAFKSAQLAANYGVDPFEGLPVYFNNSLTALSAATASTDVWLVVGDFSIGAQANFPNGDEIRIKYDELSLAESDLVKIVGREYVGLGLVSDKAFTRVAYDPS